MCFFLVIIELSRDACDVCELLSCDACGTCCNQVVKKKFQKVWIHGINFIRLNVIMAREMER